jgi:hypothetical protein
LKRTLDKSHATHISSKVKDPFDAIAGALAVGEVAKVEL